MKLVYVGRVNGPVEVPEAEKTVLPGEVLEVDADLGKRLLEQPANWKKAPRETVVEEPVVEDTENEESEEE